MSSATPWPMVKRIVWLGGSAVATNDRESEEVRLAAGLDGSEFAELGIQSFGHLFSVLQQAGFEIIGASFIGHPEEANGIWPPDFRGFFESSRAWRLSDVHTTWRQIAFAAGKVDAMGLMDVAARIASGFQSSELRLEQLVRSYSTQLRGRSLSGEIMGLSKFQDLYTRHVYLAIHGLFWEIAVLRDVLAEFASEYAFKLTRRQTFRGLIAAIRDQKVDDNFARELLGASDLNNGWIERFTSYRNLFTHGAPMGQAAGVAFAIQDKRRLQNDLDVPQIYYPLPANARAINEQRSKGPLFNSFLEFATVGNGQPISRDSRPDALNYLADVLKKFVEMGERLAAWSPLAPREMTIAASDLLGPVTITTRGAPPNGRYP